MTVEIASVSEILALLPGHLGQQRWYPGEAPEPGEVEVIASEQVWSKEGGFPRLWWLIVGVGPARYQLLLGERSAGEPADFLHGKGTAELGALSHSYLYDATVDPELNLALLPVMGGGSRRPEHVRPISVEQTNTSLVYDDALIVKIYRRIHEGANRDVLLTEALQAEGFEQVAAPVFVWRREGFDLALAQRYLVGGSDGWALAATSLRDLLASDDDDPGEAGGDFAGESRRMGVVTARMHLALVRAFGEEEPERPADAWAELVTSIEDRLAALPEEPELHWEEVAQTLRGVTDQGPLTLVHGDLHLGQMLSTDDGWFVSDFEGEPARTPTERALKASVYKDVAGMLRSFDYAARVALHERGDDDGTARLRSEAWALRNRLAFLEGYHQTDGVKSLLPDEPDAPIVLAAYELDKALYELGYERAYRPGWAHIPTDAILEVVRRIAG